MKQANLETLRSRNRAPNKQAGLSSGLRNRRISQ
jgi:hypothetical protein